MRLCVSTVFDPKTDQPLVTGLLNSQTHKSVLYDLYIPGSGRSILQIERAERTIRKILLGARDQGAVIVTSDFKSHLRAFDLPRDPDSYGAYDLMLPEFQMERLDRAKVSIEKTLERMAGGALFPYQRVIADAGVAYQDLEDHGVVHGGLLRHPRWSQRTSTGRSKVTGFNIQGLGHKSPEHISNPRGHESDVLLLFDWVSADIRMAALKSGDETLEASFRESDPYTVLADRLGYNTGEPEVDRDVRDECKRALLRGINSMDTTSEVFQVYPKLATWIERCDKILDQEDGYLDTVLGRRFRMKEKRSKKKTLNGVMQGSVAHAMQLAVRRIWEAIGPALLAEIHDSLVVTCAADGRAVNRMIRTISPIMLHPFRELYEAGESAFNPDMPFKVSVGKLWHAWKLMKVCKVDMEQSPSSSTHEETTARQEVGAEAATANQAGEPPSGAGEGAIPDRGAINSWFPAVSRNGHANLERL